MISIVDIINDYDSGFNEQYRRSNNFVEVIPSIQNNKSYFQAPLEGKFRYIKSEQHFFYSYHTSLEYPTQFAKIY